MNRELLFAALVVGLVGIPGAAGTEDPPVSSHPPVATLPPLPPADDSPAFQAVKDRRPMSFAENAAYVELLDRVRGTPIEELERTCRSDILFSQLLSNPERYRGLPIRIQGTARRVLTLEGLPESMSKDGRLHEAWVFSSDSQGFPYDLVFETPPSGLPSGDNVQAFVTFHGYFFKLLAYRAADESRVAPLLIGRLGYVPELTPQTPAPPPFFRSSPLWTALPIGFVLIYALFRLAMILQRVLAPASSSPAPRFRPPVRDQISEEELGDWLKEAGEGEHGEDHDPKPS